MILPSIIRQKHMSPVRWSICLILLLVWGSLFSQADNLTWTDEMTDFLGDHCFECHDGELAKGGLDLESLSFSLGDRHLFDQWVLIHDSIQKGEMPPAKRDRPEPELKNGFLTALSDSLIEQDQANIRERGRTSIRRLNRFEYENSLREGLKAPWLQVADKLPEDGVAHLFNKSGERLDVSHVQMAKYLETAMEALRTCLQTVAHPKSKEKFYAREERVMQNYLRYRFGQMAATRSSIPLIGTTPQPDVIRGIDPVTVGEKDPELREQEAMGFVSGTYSATTKYDFTRMQIPVDGRYRLRLKSYSFLAGPNGASGGKDHGLTGGNRAWWRPSRTFAFPGFRPEPVTLYALSSGGDSRWLTTYDATPNPSVFSCEVDLKKDEKLRPDAARLVRTRPGWKGNPNATREGIPGFALNWLEVEGPLHESWPPPCYDVLFADLPFEIHADDQVQVTPGNEEKDAQRLLRRFVGRMLRRVESESIEITPYLNIFHQARALGDSFTDGMLAAYASLLCSTDFLYLKKEATPETLASRLAFFLWNGPPDEALLTESELQQPDTLKKETERLLGDKRSRRFVNAFLDYWLDLRDILANSPDAELYPDYYLDEMLTESSVLETRMFFEELIQSNLPASALIDSDFTFVNERLAQHYGIKSEQTVALHRVSLPPDSPRGGLLTQASILRITANGTTTSPVVRGAWIGERILGMEIPTPPSNVGAVEPDTRGATTIREQLELHRKHVSCNACHQHFDPVGLALESFDIAGGYRTRYRGSGDLGDPVEGFGKNGHAFQFRLAKPVECGGEMADGTPFSDIESLKRILLKDERQIARNLLERFIVFATGSPISFSERTILETMLDACKDSNYGVRDLIHATVQSSLFTQ